MAEQAHAKLAPSAAHRWIKCPSSIALSAGIPDEAGDYAAEGTFAHSIAAQCLEDRADAVSLIGQTDGRFECDADMAQHVQTFLDAVRSIELLEGSIDELHVETKVGLHVVDVYGTADAVVLCDNRRQLHVFDFKYGAGVYVPVENNAQLRIYGAAALLTLFGALASIDTVSLHIVQPRHYSSSPAWRTERLTTADLLGWCDDVLRPAVERVEAAGTQDDLHAGEHCRFCPAKTRCPAIRDQALAAAANVFDDVETLTPAKTAPDPTELSPAQLGELLGAFPLVETWIKAVRSRAYDLANSGRAIPGYKLVKKVGNRKWNSEAEASAMLAGMGVEPFADPKLITPAEAERRLGKARKKRVEPLTHKPLTGTVLVEETDSRPAISVGAVFTDN